MLLYFYKSFNSSSFFHLEHQTGNESGKRRRIRIAIGVSLGTVLVVGLTLAISLFCLRKRKLKAQRLYGTSIIELYDVNRSITQVISLST